MDIDFRQISAHGGSQRDAFEELCCQLGRRSIPEHVQYTRLLGSGGDGGVECYADYPDGTRQGWQAKYVFDIRALVSQADKSLSTALQIHPNLRIYIVCFPFDLTGTTTRGKGSQEKWSEWCASKTRAAADNGRDLTIESWPAAKLRDLLLRYDSSGGVREFFFNQKILTHWWFTEHLSRAHADAGPRYTPELHVETDLWHWFSAFGRTADWEGTFRSQLSMVRTALAKFASAAGRKDDSSGAPSWPDGLRRAARAAIDDVQGCLDACDLVLRSTCGCKYNTVAEAMAEHLCVLESMEAELLERLRIEHPGKAVDSPGFRSFMAGYMLSFPTANLDDTRSLLDALHSLQDWFISPACRLAFENVFLLTGAAGSGKTHGICDVASRRLEQNLYTCIAFGHAFRGEPDPWTRITESLGLPPMGMERLLDTLNTAAMASGRLLILCIDAINETRPLAYWLKRLGAFLEAVRHRQGIRLCISCRTTFLAFCVPTELRPLAVEHTGFRGIERAACTTFFRHYGLAPPVAPILQPEFANPLYLRLMCQAMQSKGLTRLPVGWHSLGVVVRAFLDEKEKQFAEDHSISPGARIVSGSLIAIASKLAGSAVSAIPRSEALGAAVSVRPEASSLQIVDWLIGADLLVEDAPLSDDPLGAETLVRPAFERLGDFLVAQAALSQITEANLEDACKEEGVLGALWHDPDRLKLNVGVLEALSIILPERFVGTELPDLVAGTPIHDSLLKIMVKSVGLRDPDYLTHATEMVIRTALESPDLFFCTMECLIANSWRSSALDALWLDALLKSQFLASRDSFWCPYLHQSYQSEGAVYHMIGAALELPLSQLESVTAERWAVALLWFTAAADRRVRDGATRAVTAILGAKPSILPALLERLLSVDDDHVRERLLLAAYGALILSRCREAIMEATAMLHDAYCQAPIRFDNALIRDHIRCISELAKRLDALPDGCNAEATMQPADSGWPLELPSADQAKEWSKAVGFRPGFGCDFFNYTMDCLHPWVHAHPKEELAMWITQRMARDFGYTRSNCDHHDRYIIARYGFDRGNPRWAERIAKKYQWMALYQLAARLHDHVERHSDSWEPEPEQIPMILQEERKLDPTLPLRALGGARPSSAWWATAAMDIPLDESLTNRAWTTQTDDLPTFKALLSPVKQDGRQWIPLVAFLSWGGRDGVDRDQSPHRDVWIHVKGYLVQAPDASNIMKSLATRNFFGGWMPDAPSWSHGFVGEYPWAPPFNILPDYWYTSTGRDRLPFDCRPSWNELAVEWEYDATLPHNVRLLVPAREFFAKGDLWWDGGCGYKDSNGETVFADPSAFGMEPSALIAAEQDLLDRLDSLGMRLFWTLLGEKRARKTSTSMEISRVTFSQVACLGRDGSIEFTKRVFFDDYEQAIGPCDIGFASPGVTEC